jgi:hypothetical protein
VIGVEPAQEELLGLSAAGVLGDHESGRETEKLLRRLPRPEPDVELAHDARGCRRHRALRGDDGWRERKRCGLEPEYD